MILQRFLTMTLLIFCFPTFGNAQEDDNDILTSEERQWLNDHPVIRLAPTPDYRPAEWFDDEGNFLGIEFEIVRTESWTENLRMLRDREVDAFPLAAETPERLKFARFTEPYIDFPAMILVRTGDGGLAAIPRRKLSGNETGTGPIGA